jgi:hypothetical protein
MLNTKVNAGHLLFLLVITVVLVVWMLGYMDQFIQYRAEKRFDEIAEAKRQELFQHYAEFMKAEAAKSS